MTFGWTKRAVRRHSGVMTASLFLFAVLSPLSGAEAAGVSGVEIGAERITIRFDDVVEKASSFVLAGPDRLALDIGGAEPGPYVEASGIVRQVRQGRFDANTARIVFDLDMPAVVTGGRFAADGKSLTLSLGAVDSDRFETAVNAERKLFLPPPTRRAQPPRSKYNITIPLDPPSNGLPRPRIFGTAGKPLVVIDAGHGGHDPGAISPVTGKREKDITLAVALAIRDQLAASGRVRVALTREDDRFLVLRERSAIARNIKADLFISIHADSAPSGDATGATVYTLSEVASDREAQLLATRENKADVINGINLGGENREIASILVDLAQRETMNTSTGFANLLRRESTGLIPFRSDYHRMADLAVLKSPDTPSVLFEVGYVTNSSDVNRLSTGDGQERIASGIRKAVEIHFAKRLASR